MGEKGAIWPQVLGAFGATMGAFSLGNIVGWANDASNFIQEGDDGHCSDEADMDCLTEAEFFQVNALFNIGAAIVPFVTIFLFPKIGKKWTMILLVIPNVAGWVLIIFSTQAWMFDLGRVMTGFSGGAFALAAPAFSNEIAEPRIRGALGTMMQLMICMGILFVLLLVDKVHWQVSAGLCIIPSAILGIMLFFLPRSPVYLVQKDDYDEARKSLRFYRRKKDVEEELKEIQAEVEEQRKVGMVNPMQLLTKGVYLKPFLISLMLMGFQQLSGVNFVNGFVNSIFQDSGSTIDPYVSGIIIGVVQVVGVFIALAVVDRFGRKVLLTISGLLMTISHIMLGTFFLLKNSVKELPSSVAASTTVSPTTLPSTTVALQSAGVLFNSSVSQALVGSAQMFFEEPETYVTQETVDNLGWLPLVSLIIFMASFNLGFGPLPWVMNVELFSSEARVPAAALCGCFNWLVSYGVMTGTPELKNATSDEFCYFFFAGVCLTGTLLVMFITPETKAKSEEDMRKYFQASKGCKVCSWK